MAVPPNQLQGLYWQCEVTVRCHAFAFYSRAQPVVDGVVLCREEDVDGHLDGVNHVLILLVPTSVIATFTESVVDISSPPAETRNETGGEKEGVSWKNVVNDGERTISAWNVRILSPSKKQDKRGFESWPMTRNRQEYKASGSRNRRPENTWSK